MIINLIAAVGKHGQLGLDGKLPWYDNEDLKWFKKMTLGEVIVVGKITFQSLPNLPDRTIVTQTRDKSPKDIIRQLSSEGFETIWVAGGEQIYRLWMPYIHRSFITHIDYDGPADTYMPPLW